ncbi:hypothetical protein DL93DRAFT_1435907 [Clavulina sp. PMI_390]|nr:hypothetical protein DL93DRAFT_1435907 [Clavulina sp. PMI_390]
MLSRSTAKKFLTAANFFEILTVFKSIPSYPENNARFDYAKYRASAIVMDMRSPKWAEDPRSQLKAVPHPSTLKFPPRPRRVNAGAASNIQKPLALPKPPSPEPTEGARYLMPPSQPQPQRASPTSQTISSHGSLPTSAAPSNAPSPSAATQLPLPPSPNLATVPKLPAPQVTAQTREVIPEPPSHKDAPNQPTSRQDTKPPVSATPGNRPRTRTNENLPQKSGFFATIGKVLSGSRDGQTTPGGWSSAATPGTEDGQFRLPVQTLPLLNDKPIPPPPPPDLGAPSEARPRARRPSVTGPSPLSNTVMTHRPVGSTSSSSGEELNRLLKQQLTVPPHRHDSLENGTTPSARQQPLTPPGDGKTQTMIPNPPSGLQRSRRLSASEAQRPPPPHEDSFPTPSKIAEIERRQRRQSQDQATTRSTSTAQPVAIQSRVAALKRVHFSGSVVGGLSSVASTSPPSSPTEGSFDVPIKATNTPITPARRPRPLSTSDMGGVLPLRPTITPIVGQTPNPPINTSRYVPSGSTKPNEAPVSARETPSAPMTSALPIPSRQRAQSFGQPSSSGSAGSWGTSAYNTGTNFATTNTIATSNDDKSVQGTPRPQLPPLQMAPTNGTQPVSIPPISRTLPPPQQPTPSPSPPHIPAQILTQRQVKDAPPPSPSPVSYRVPGPPIVPPPAPNATPKGLQAKEVPPVAALAPLNATPAPITPPVSASNSSSSASNIPSAAPATGVPMQAAPARPKSMISPPIAAISAPSTSASSSTSTLTSPPPLTTSSNSGPKSTPISTPRSGVSSLQATPKPTAAHISTPYTRHEELPISSALSAAMLGSEAINVAKRHTAYAITAFEWQDVETIKRELRAALAALEGNSAGKGF